MRAHSSLLGEPSLIHCPSGPAATSHPTLRSLTPLYSANLALTMALSSRTDTISSSLCSRWMKGRHRHICTVRAMKGIRGAPWELRTGPQTPPGRQPPRPAACRVPSPASTRQLAAPSHSPRSKRSAPALRTACPWRQPPAWPAWPAWTPWRVAGCCTDTRGDGAAAAGGSTGAWPIGGGVRAPPAEQ